MNTSALKAFAPRVRRELMEAVERKLDFVLTGDTADLRANAAQVERLREESRTNRAELVERVAYTWFNRLAALRFLDARGWHPFRARVLTPASAQETQPELLKLVRTGTLPKELAPFIDPARLNDLLDGRLPSPDPQGEVYRHLVLAACRFYHNLMPFLFERLDDETELLLPDDLLSEHSVAHGFRTEIADEDCAEVEILGWLYQFYISEKKDQVMARKTAVPSEDIPAVTQLFTPHWIVRYLVENSLGRLWLRSRPGSRLQEHMPYYVEDPDSQPPEDSLVVARPEDIRLLDLASGSGHMLTYAFDLLTRIYEEEGYAANEIPEKILTHNLYGLEICPRATQLAQFALVCKAREQSRSAFRSPIQPQVMCLRDVVIPAEEMGAYLRLPGARDLFTQKVLRQVHQFREDTSTFGSLIQPILNEGEISSLKGNLDTLDPGQDLLLQETHRKIRLALDQAEMLTQRYHVVVTNPPYMGSLGMPLNLKVFLERHYANFKSDLFAAFIARICDLTMPGAMAGVMSPFVWMFLSSYAPLRHKLMHDVTITTLVQPEYHAFFDSAYVPICAFVIMNGLSSKESVFIRLSDFYGQDVQAVKTLEAIRNPSVSWRYSLNPRMLTCIPGGPLAYWAPESVLRLFRCATLLTEFAKPRAGLATGDNGRFQRWWFEVSRARIEFSAHSTADTRRIDSRWYPCNSGGAYRKWFGNNETIVNWENDGQEIRHFTGKSGRLASRSQNTDYYFKLGVTWTKLGSGHFGARYTPGGFVFDDTGRSAFPNKEEDVWLLLSLMCSSSANFLLGMLNPTMSFTSGDISRLPITTPNAFGPALPRAAVALARADWDSFETSWDVKELPMLRSDLKGPTLAASWENWESHVRANIARMQELETENNRLWIEAYGLEEELSPEVPEEEITLARPDRRKDMAAFLSYAVGCMMGRYSLDAPGLILADAGDSVEEYLAKVGRSTDELTFPPDEDGIVPVLDGEWFEDDIVARTRDFLRATFGAATLEENLRFIEESLGKDLRKYFLTDFYKDHLQTYKKRPIYWMVQSPKKGFQCLIYLHRYTRDTANRVLNRYLRDYLGKLEARLDYLVHLLASESTPTREKTKAQKEGDTLRKTLRECREWERAVLLPLAQQRVELDLDDGVKVNYLKLGSALAPIPGLAAAGAD